MRIVCYQQGYPPDARVGAYLTTHLLLAHLVKLGHEVHVVRRFGPNLKDYELDGVIVHHGTTSGLASWVPKADVVACNAGGSGLPSQLAQEHDRPLMVFVHGDDVTRSSIKDAAAVVFNSEAARRECAGWHHSHEVVVPPPIWADDYRTTPGECVTLVNLTKAKGVTTFWKAAELLPDVPFLGIKGGYGSQVIPRARNVRVEGPTSDMRSVYSQTKILLMPSSHETYGRVGLEAMVSGIPVIAHPTPGLKESLGDAGVFINRDDHKAWAEMIRRLLRPSAWAVLSRQARLHAGRLNPAADLEHFARTVEALA